jgi:DNA polymerase-1
MTKIILLDSNSLINRAFYAIPPMTTRDGQYTNAVYGYLSMLARLISEHRPTHIGAAFDLRAPTFRHGMYDGYKATRKPMPEELASQVGILKTILKAMNIRILEKEGYEADDIIGTFGKRFDCDTIIVSGDRDVLQLVDHNTVVFHTRRGVTDIKVYNLESLAEENLTPQKIIEYKSLAGDSSDNIPGCPGVGEKTALALLEQFGSVDNLYAHIEEIKGRLKDKLLQNKELVYLSGRLATINTNVPLDCGLEELAFGNEYNEDFFALLARYEFRSLAERFRKSGKDAAPKAQILSGQALPEDASPVACNGKPFAANRVKINSIDELKAILGNKIDKISLEIGSDIRFALNEGTEYFIEPAQSLLDPGINSDEAVCCFRSVMESDAQKIVFDVKALMHRFAAYGIEIRPPYEDLLIKYYLIDVNRVPASLTELASGFGGSEVCTAAAFRLNETADEKLKEWSLTDLYAKIELPLVSVLFDMENAGFMIDETVLRELSDRYTEELNLLQKKIFAMAGEVFNINSPQQLSVILFDKLGLRPAGMTKGKTGYSVAAGVLEELEHPIVEEILKYRMFSKLMSTYINGMRAVRDPKSGRVHTVFRQCLTATGRLSSNEPNLQNIPIRNEEGRNIRRMFVPSPGNLLVSADYSQIELRLLAHFSGDPELLKAYNENIDIHTLTASRIFDIPLNEVTRVQRRDAKAVNFGIIYGISGFGLARNTGISNYEARQFITKYFLTYPDVKKYMDTNVAFAKEKGYIRTLAGRLRFFPELKSPNRNIRSFGERAAMNMPLQGSASDIIKIAMLNVHKALAEGGYKAKLILQVHDELVLDAPEQEVPEVKKLLVECMQNAVRLQVPLIAEAKSGKDWYSVE